MRNNRMDNFALAKVPKTQPTDRDGLCVILGNDPQSTIARRLTFYRGSGASITDGYQCTYRVTIQN